MAAVAFDTLKFARRLIKAGMPENLAEAQAEFMAEAFLFNLKSLVTRDYLEARLDAKFAEANATLDKLISELSSRWQQELRALHERLERRLLERDEALEGSFGG